MLYDIKSHIDALTLVAPAVLTADNTPVEVDLQDYNAVGIYLYVGAGGITFTGTNKIEFKLSHGSTSGSLTAVTADEVDGIADADLTDGSISDGIIKSLKSAHAAASWYKFNYTGRERYVELLADFSGTHGTGTSIMAMVLADPLVTSNVASPKTGVA